MSSNNDPKIELEQKKADESLADLKAPKKERHTSQGKPTHSTAELDRLHYHKPNFGELHADHASMAAMGHLHYPVNNLPRDMEYGKDFHFKSVDLDSGNAGPDPIKRAIDFIIDKIESFFSRRKQKAAKGARAPRPTNASISRARMEQTKRH